MSDKMHRLIQLFDDTGKAIHKHVCAIDDDMYQMNISHVKVLQLICDSDRVAMNDVASHLNITPASATSIVDKMVKEGWLQRVNDDEDRRKVYILIANDKVDYWKEFKEKQNERLAKFLDVLTDQQKEEMILIMESLTRENN